MLRVAAAILFLGALAGCADDCGGSVAEAAHVRGRDRRPNWTRSGSPDAAAPDADPLDANYAIVFAMGGQSPNLINGTTDAALSTDASVNYLLDGSAGAIMPLVEITGETPRYGMAQQLTYLSTGGLRRVAVFNMAVAATDYPALKKGTTPYNNGQAAQDRLFTALASSLGGGYVPCLGPLVVREQETPTQNGTTAAQHAANLAEWANDWRNDSVAAGHAPCPGAPLLVFTQEDDWTTNNGGQLARATTAMGAYDLYYSNPTQYVLAGSNQQINQWNSDGLHENAHGKRRVGEELLAKAQNFGWITAQRWDPLGPDVISCSGTNVHITLKGGHGTSDVVEDTTLMAPKPMLGFEYGETSPQTELPVVIAAACAGHRYCDLTLDRNCDTDARIRYKYSAVPMFSANGALLYGSIGGNIRNQDDTVDAHDASVTSQDWMVGFDRALDECTGNCGTPSSTWTYGSRGSFLQDNSPPRWLSCAAPTDLDGGQHFTFSVWVKGNGSSFNNGGARVIFARNTTSNRQVDFRGTGTNAIQLTVAGTLTATDQWTSAASAMAGCANSWCHVYGYLDLTQADNASKVHIRLNDSDITAAGSFTTTIPGSFSSGSKTDLSIGGSSSCTASTSSGNCSQALEGKIALLYMWNVTGTAGNGTSIYNSGSPTVDPKTVISSPIHVYPLDTNGRDIGTASPYPCRVFGDQTSAGWSSDHP